MDYEFNVLYYINMYKKWWKKIALVMVVSISLTACISFFLPVTYVSTVTFLSTGGGSSEGALGKFLGLSGLSTGSSTDLIIPLLNSRRMSKDIRERFNLDKKPRFRYSISTRKMSGAMAIDIKGSDPVLTEKIANFAVQNLDKINIELEITPNKPMVKVLDFASRGVPQSREIKRKMFVAGLAVFLFMSLRIFFSEYLKRIKGPAL